MLHPDEMPLDFLQLEAQIDELELEIYDPTSKKVVKHTSSEYAWKRLVLFFYPADFTFVCPTELRDLNKQLDAIRAQNAEILVVSTDTVFTHKRWVETEQLLEGFGINMVADRTADLSTYFNCYNDETGNSERGTFIISPDWVVKSIEVVTEPIGRSSAELVRKLTALEFVRSNPGHACPSSRNTGSKTIKPAIDMAWKVELE